jgi:polyhydroxyalkanoate synthesis regulator protein
VIRQGIEIRVVDHTNGEDLTAIVLSQILLAQEKRQGGMLPTSWLTALVHAGGNAVGLLSRWIAGSIDFGIIVDEEIKRRIEILASQGRLTPQESRYWLDVMEQAGKDNPPAPFLGNRLLDHTLESQGFASRSDFQRLLSQVDELSAQIEILAHHKDD